MFGRKKKGKKDYPEMVDSIQGSPKEEPDYVRNTGNFNSYPMEQDEWPQDIEYDNPYTPEQINDVPESDNDFRNDTGDQQSGEISPDYESSFPEEKGEPDNYGYDFQGNAGEKDDILPEPDVPSERDLARIERKKRRKRELRRVRFAFAFFIICILALGGLVGYQMLKQQGIQLFGSDGVISSSALGSKVSGWLHASDPSDSQKEKNENKQDDVQAEDSQQEPESVLPEGADGAQTEHSGATEAETVPETESPAQIQARAELMAQADLMAAQYDYDGAAGLLKSQKNYESDTELQQKAAEYEAAKAACVEISPDTVEHVFVHSLIVDPSRAFDGDSAQDGYNLNMVTVEEFKKVIQSMYDKGYVLVSLHDMGEIDANGQMQRKSIWLPEGKKPIVFSQDDVSYYHTYSGDGFADRLIVDENGEVKNEYTDADGNTTVGDYDMVPVLDTFIKEHPDFSYHGRKGIVVLTGYNGVFGYRTDGDYRDQLNLQEDQRKWLDAHPDFDFDADVAAATAVADAMKANGWEFASHTWGHISVSDKSLEEIKTDTQKWLDYVKPIVGDTDMIIFAFGSDIGDWTGYASDNEKFNYLKSVGFDYFCNVDGSTLCWVQFGNTYLRQARMNIDGYRMATNPDILSPLFNVSDVYDTSRPEMPEWTQ